MDYQRDESHVSVAQLLLAEVVAASSGSGKAPDQISGLTLWLDFNDPAYTFANTTCTTAVATNGDNVKGAINKAGIGANFTNSGTNGTWVTNAQNGRAALKKSYGNAMSGSTFTNYVTVANFLMVAVVKLSGVTTTSANYAGYDIITGGAGGGNYGGMLFTNASPSRVYAYNWDGSDNYAYTNMSQDVWAVVVVQHKGGNVRSSINGGSFTTTASGNTTSLTSTTYIGDGSLGGDLYVGECSIHNTAVSDADVADLITWYRARWGI